MTNLSYGQGLVQRNKNFKGEGFEERLFNITLVFDDGVLGWNTTGSYTLRGSSSNNFYPKIRPVTAPNPSYHIEHRIIDHLSRTNPQAIRKLGKGLTINLVHGNENMSTTRPCNVCTNRLVKTIPLAKIHYKVDGKMVKEAVADLNSDAARSAHIGVVEMLL